jgi:predicted ribosome-associated RNA-binding protein Tma20
MANDEDYKVMIAACKECGKEFEVRIPLHIYETIVAACEEDGETPVFVGRCACMSEEAEHTSKGRS